MQKRARAGGEKGRNGEWYEGGKFLPGTEQPKRAPQRSRSTGRVLVAPGQLEAAPQGMRSIFARINIFCGINPDGTVFIGKRFTENHPAVQEYSNGLDELQDLARRFNAGERWIGA